MSSTAKMFLSVQSKLDGEAPSTFPRDALLDYQWVFATMLIAGDYK